jgi:L-threonylcarbamoyladenylate synthase
MPKVSEPEIINQAQQGKVISFPTDTVPALAARPIFCNLIFAAKKRPLDKPLILMGAKAEDLWPYVTGTEEEKNIWQQVTQQYWPGQLTLVLPAAKKVPPVMNPLDPSTIGIRVPNHVLALKILAQTGPLATTSANFSGEAPLMTPTEIVEKFSDVFVLDVPQEDYLGSGLPSTVAKWTKQGWEILRQGGIRLEG